MIKHTKAELEKMIKSAPLLEPPAGAIVADLAQQLIDVQERLRNVLPDTLVSDEGMDDKGHIYNSFVEGVELSAHWNAYINGFFEKQNHENILPSPIADDDQRM